MTFWRPLTDNDRPVDGPYWQRFGLDHLQTKVHSVAVRDSRDDFLEITVLATVAPPILSWRFETEVVYSLYADKLRISSHCVPRAVSPEMIPDRIPRVGWELATANHFRNCDWFGHGPHESYSDKMAGTSVGLFSKQIDLLGYKYEVPQENGNHQDTRWVELSNGKVKLLTTMVEGNVNIPFAFKVSDEQNLDEALHPYEIVRGQPLLRIDYRHQGLGSQSCGPPVISSYRVPVEEAHFDIVLDVDI